MDVNDLLVFVKVVQAGSFSRASKLLGMPKSTVSRRVAELEDGLGVSLLHRTTRSLRITDVGAGYLRHGLKIAAEIEMADALLVSRQSVPQGRLKIGAPVDFGSQYLGKVVRDFLHANTLVSVDLVLSERVVDLVSEGYDLSIRIGDLDDSSLTARKIGTLDMQLYASPAYLDKHGAPKTCGELAQHQCLVFTGEEDAPKWRLRGPKGPMTIKPSGRVTANNMALIRELALQGDGVALMPYFFCAEDVRRGRLKPVLSRWVSMAGPIHAVFPGQRHLLPKVRAFVEHLVIEFKNGPWRATES